MDGWVVDGQMMGRWMDGGVGEGVGGWVGG